MRFLLLCLGVVALLVFWLLAVVVYAGLAGAWHSWWVLAGIPVALFLLFVGFMLVMGYDEPDNDGPVSTLFTIWVFVAIGTGFVAFAAASMAGPQLYHQRFGEPTAAVVTSISAINSENGGVAHWTYSVENLDGEHLGWLADPPLNETAEGDRIEVFVDPHGLLPPVSADSLRGTTPAAVVLACCLGVMVLFDLAIIVAGAYRRTGVPRSKASR